MSELSYMKPIKLTNDGDIGFVIGIEKNQIVAILTR